MLKGKNIDLAIVGAEKILKIITKTKISKFTLMKTIRKD